MKRNKHFAGLCMFLVVAACQGASLPEPPEGDEVEFERLTVEESFCELETALLARVESDVDLSDNASCPALESELIADVNALDETESIVVFSLTLGGCQREFRVPKVVVNDDELRVWVVTVDSTNGDANVACPADAFIEVVALKVQDGREPASVVVEMSEVYERDVDLLDEI